MAKRTKVKLPKRIAGVKIPKAVRRGPIVDFLNSSGGQLLLAEALVLAAGVFAVKGADGEGNGQGRVPSIAEASARLSHAFGEGVRAFRHALANPPPAALRSESHDDDEDEPRTSLREENEDSLDDRDAGDARRSASSSERSKKKPARSPREPMSPTPS